ncbi:hypothetical protein QUA74_13345 [Microcoleus sp. LAD1_D3]|uniref:hypothetical protein n=1 Tax=Microcoleus sp. LAD1_D3 TaxID=2819365 RepID=UPI002FCEA70D
MSVFKENSNDICSFIPLCRFSFDLGLEVGEVIQISNLSFLEKGYIFNVKVVNKLKTIEQQAIETYHDEEFTFNVEYFVDVEKEEDLTRIRQRLKRS